MRNAGLCVCVVLLAAACVTVDMRPLAELRDSQSGAILVRAADLQRGRQSGSLQMAHEMASSAEAQRVIAIWADLLRNALDTAKAQATAAAK
jgi:hypothetical protein